MSKPPVVVLTYMVPEQCNAMQRNATQRKGIYVVSSLLCAGR